MQEVEGYDGREFLDALIARGRKRTPLWIFAHDLPSAFTWVGGWRALRFGRFGFEWREVRKVRGCKPENGSEDWRGLFIDNDPPVSLQLWTERGCKAFWIDVRNYFDQPLGKLAKRVNRVVRQYPEGWPNRLTALIMARKQAEVVRLTMAGLMDSHRETDQGTWGMTATSLAWRSFRHAHYRSNIRIHNHRPAKLLEREAFKGGLIDCFRVGEVEGKVFQLDVNGLYPHLMRENDFPAACVASWDTAERNAMRPEYLSENHIAEVELATRHERFPVRLEKRGLCYCIGRFRTVLAGPELVRAKRAGAIVRVFRWTCYKRANLFSTFVDYWTQRRAECKRKRDHVGAEFAKRLAVGLFGRFGLRSFKWKPLSQIRKMPAEWQGMTDDEILKWIWLTDGIDGQRIAIHGFEDGRSEQLRRVGNHWQVAQPPDEIPNSFPAIPAYVTAYGRELMIGLRKLAGDENCFYVSTDSLIVNRAGFEALDAAGMVDPLELGKLKIEAEGESCEILAPHYYRVGRKRKSGNEPREQWISPEGETFDVIGERLQTLIHDGQSGIVKRQRLRVSRRPIYRNGFVNPDGTTRPIILGVDQWGAEEESTVSNQLVASGAGP